MTVGTAGSLFEKGLYKLKMSKLKYLIPVINKKQFSEAIKIAITGAFIAGLYGVIHDQVTYTISNEYFTKLKFQQFSYIDFGLPDRLKVFFIGFLATWWVGFFSGWFVSRLLLGNKTDRVFLRSLGYFKIILTAAFCGSLCGFILAIFHDDNYSSWLTYEKFYKINDISSFVKVAYIHNCGNAGGLAGLIVSLVLIKRVNRGDIKWRPAKDEL